MSDLISRDQVIEAISKLLVKVDNLGYTWMIAGDVLKQIDTIPSAESEQTAKFRRDGDFLRCSKCWRIVDSGYNYCPNCGAKLDWSE